MHPQHEASVVVVGSGITGLMTAWEACRAGCAVTVVTQSPDPRTAGGDEPQFSSTFDSPNDQRYITLFEGHPYLELDGYIGRMYQGIGDAFVQSAVEGGVLSAPADQFSSEARAWLDSRRALNDAIGENGAVTRSVERLFNVYEQENRAAMAMWFEVLAHLVDAEPRLIDSMTLHHRGIVRLYDESVVYEQALASHAEGGVLLRSSSPEELVRRYPAYAAGVQNGFIRGGALETVGLAIGAKAVGRTLIDLVERAGGRFAFGTRAQRVLVDRDVVTGLELAGGRSIEATHYFLHTGAYAVPALFEQVPGVSVLAAVAGHWLTVEQADALVAGMGHVPNKVHGKQSLEALLERVPLARRRWYSNAFRALGLTNDHLSSLSPIVDFNNMPMKTSRGPVLGVGSGYLFEGIATADGSGDPAFRGSTIASAFTMLVMRLWLEALHGHALLSGGVVAHERSCRRSWTADDRELDVNLPTREGGLLGIRGGGNTGDTTKSALIARYNVGLLGAARQMGASALPDVCLRTRRALRRTPSDLGLDQWRQYTQMLDESLTRARTRTQSS